MQRMLRYWRDSPDFDQPVGMLPARPHLDQRHLYVKPSSRDYPLGLASPLNYAAIQSGNIKSPSKKEAGLDISHHTLFPAREGERIVPLTSSFIG